MRVKLLRPLHFRGNKTLEVGTELEARLLPSLPFQFNAPYQIIEGPCSGFVVSREDCVEVNDLKVYTKEQMETAENYHKAKFDKEKEAKERAEKFVRDLTRTLNEKNVQIEQLEEQLKQVSTEITNMYVTINLPSN